MPSPAITFDCEGCQRLQRQLDNARDAAVAGLIVLQLPGRHVEQLGKLALRHAARLAPLAKILGFHAEHTMHGNHRLYTIERMANWRGEPPYKWAGNTISLKSARIVLREATRAAA